MSVDLAPSAERLYAQVTPAGAFYAVSSPEHEGNRAILLRILEEGGVAPFATSTAMTWAQSNDAEDALRSIFRLQRLGMVRGSTAAPLPIQDRLEDILPSILARLSNTGKALLADENGFYLATAGFLHEAAEELAGLSADLIAMQTRHSRLLKNNLQMVTEAWALVDQAGRSELGFWPLFIGKQRFMLITSGTPCIQNQAFVTLVQVLDQRYR